MTIFLQVLNVRNNREVVVKSKQLLYVERFVINEEERDAASCRIDQEL